jgi:hypothetical protein
MMNDTPSNDSKTAINFRAVPMFIWAALSLVAFWLISMAPFALTHSNPDIANALVFWSYWVAVAWFGFRIMTGSKASEFRASDVRRFVLVCIGVTALGVFYASVLIVSQQVLSGFPALEPAKNPQAAFVSSSLIYTVAFFTFLFHGNLLLGIAAGTGGSFRGAAISARKVLLRIAVFSVLLGVLSALADEYLVGAGGIAGVVHWLLGSASIVLTGWFR